MSVIIGIDVGGSTTKIVAVRDEGGVRTLIEPQIVKANDPVTATYGAFGKFTDENGLKIQDITRVMMTGVGSSFVKRDLYGLDCRKVEEFNSIGVGGLYLSGLDEALVVSMGTGTAMVHAKRGGKMNYLGGTGVGGGTLLGLTKLLTGAESSRHIEELASAGDLEKIDLRIKHMTESESLSALSRELTAANFGKVSDLATHEDVALGAMNLVFETIGMVSVFAARSVRVRDVVLTGNVTQFAYCKEKFDFFNDLGYGVKFLIPERSRFATAIGAALLGFGDKGVEL
jgi:type II pantothenate kinase